MTDHNKPGDAISDEGTPVEPVPKSSASAGAAPASDRGPEELPYIDDPVSKWWIAIIVAVFALIFAWAIFFGAGGIFDSVFDSDDSSPSPEPTVVASPTLEPTEEPTLEPTEEPTLEPTEEPTAEPTLGPCPTLDPEASLERDASPMPHASTVPPPVACYTPAPEVSPSAEASLAG